jgi:hypothetical protein
MATSSLGPVELLVIKFPGNQFKGEIGPALGDLVDSGTIRILDLLFAIKDEDGAFDILEVRELESGEMDIFEPLLTGGNEFLSEEDIQNIASMLEPNSSAAVLLFEDTWAVNFRDALANANAQLIYNIRIPQAVVEELLAEKAQLESERAAAEATA